MTPRAVIFALVLMIGGGFAIPTTAVHAQICNPQCAANEICVFKGDAQDTECIPAGQNGSVEPLVITAPKSSGLSFAQLVDTKLVPLGDQIVTLLFAVATIVFLWGMFGFFFTQGPEGRKKGRAFMIYGIIGLAVLFSVWGLVNIMLSTFNSLR